MKVINSLTLKPKTHFFQFFCFFLFPIMSRDFNIKMASVQLSVCAEKTTARKVNISLLCVPYTILSFINEDIQNSIP